MSALLELAERCEKATGPDRELDVEIALICGGSRKIGGQVEHYGQSSYRLTQGMTLADTVLLAPRSDCAIWNDVPHFTASLNAAMTLVPEGQRRVEFGTYNGGDGWAYVHIGSERGDHLGESEDCATEALALCAAALRARARAPLAEQEQGQ